MTVGCCDHHRFDVVGDVHGELPALEALGTALGYNTVDGWRHPAGRTLVFLGDLIDRGAHSLEVAELVLDLCRRRRALLLMGNHEFNLVAFYDGIVGYERPKSENRATIEQARDEGFAARWRKVVDSFRQLPVALELSDLRVVHACWDRPSLESIDGVMGQAVILARTADTFDWLSNHVRLRSPFGKRGLRPGLTSEPGSRGHPAHEIPIKGYLAPDSQPGERRRVCWWETAPGERLRPVVFGHYWNLPPLSSTLVPPYGYGDPRLNLWQDENRDAVPQTGCVAVDDQAFLCIDFNGVTRHGPRACVGALHWPERQIIWATAERTHP